MMCWSEALLAVPWDLGLDANMESLASWGEGAAFELGHAEAQRRLPCLWNWVSFEPTR